MASGQPPGTDPTSPWQQQAAVPAMGTQPGQEVAGGDPRQQPPFVMNEEERRVLKECERDSFYQRGLPFSAGCMVAAQLMVKTGRWNPHPRFGSIPKVIIAGSIGYFAGKISYLPVCQQKILDKIPNSKIAAAIRKSKGIPEPEAQMGAWEPSGDSSKRMKDDYTAVEGLDDRFRPTMDRDVKAPASPEATDQPPESYDSPGGGTGKTTTTYEELRRRNRQDYEANLNKQPPKPPGSPSYKDSPHMPQRPWPDRTPKEDDTSPPPQEPPKRRRTNMWGDPID